MKALPLLASCLVGIMLSACAAPAPNPGGGSGDCHGATTRNWHAWVNLQPGSDRSLHVKGTVDVNSGGWQARLTKRSPQGFNPRILLLDLHVTPPSGPTILPMLSLDVRYDERNAGNTYDRVEVYCGNERIADMQVEQAH